MSIDESKMKTFVDWAFLPYPALNLISKCLTFDVDYVRFRSVCTSWRSAAPQTAKLPLLASFYATPDDQSSTCILSTFSDSQTIPTELQLQDFPPRTLCFGSSHGWLALFDLDERIILFNPFTKSQIHLPPFYQASGSFPCIATLHYTVPLGICLSSNPSSDSNFLILQLTPELHNPLAFLRYGDDSWTSIPHFGPRPVEFALFHEERIVFVHGRKLCACKLRQEDGEMTVEEISLPNPPVDDQIIEQFLLESSGDLLLVILYCVAESVEVEEEENDSEDEVSLLDVFRVDFTGEKMNLVKVEALSDCSLFLGPNHSISVCANKYPLCRPNSVYCAHYDIPGYRSTIYGVSIEDSDDQRINWPNSSHPPPWRKLTSMWVTPSLLS